MTRRVFGNMDMRPGDRPFLFGQHLIMNLTGCRQYDLSSPAALEMYVTRLVEVLDMTAYGPVQIQHFGHASPQTSGFTVLQLIETSLISGHMVDAEATAYWDVFSCKPFEVDPALELTEQRFRPEVLTWRVLYR
jgi:S-adenosylmethionine decarboxylase